MATITVLGSIFDTNAGTHTVTASPAVDDLIVIVAARTGSSGANLGSVTPTDDNGSGTYSVINTCSQASGANQGAIYIRTAKVASAVSTIFSHAQGASSTGGGLIVYAISGVQRVGSAASRNDAIQNNRGAGGTPTPVLSFAALTDNVIVGMVLNSTNPAGMTPRGTPAYSEGADLGYATPTSGLESMYITSGETGTSIAWGGTSASAFGSIVIEIWTSAAVNKSESTAVTDTPTIRMTSYINVSDSSAVADTPSIQTVQLTNNSDSTAVSDSATIRIGPIFFDATSTSLYQASLSTYNWSHTVGVGNNRILIIGVAIFTTGTVSSVTAGSKSATLLRADSNGVYRSELWYVVAPDLGTQTITVNLSTSLTSIGGAVSYSGVYQNGPFEGTTGANGIGGSNTVNVSTTINYDTVIDATATLTNPITVGSGQVERVNNGGALGSLGIGDRQWVAPSTVAANWTGTGILDPWAITATAMIPAQAIASPDISDSTAIGETVTLSLSSYVNVSDTTTVTDAPNVFITVLFFSVSDSTTLNDSPSLSPISYISVTDSTAIGDTVSISIVTPVTATGYSFVIIID